MASLCIRKLDPSVYARLSLQATKHGLSMEEEVRQILAKAVAAPEKISGVFTACFGLVNGVDLDLLSQRSPHNPMEF